MLTFEEGTTAICRNREGYGVESKS